MKQVNEFENDSVKPKQNSELAVIGTMAIDSITTPFGEKPAVFGGSASYFSLAASLFIPTAVLAVIGEDFPNEYLEVLKQRGIDVSNVEKQSGKTFAWKGEYKEDLNIAHTLETHLNVLQTFDPKLTWEKPPRVVFLANIDPELQLKVLDQIRRPKAKLVGCDTMNYWISSKKPQLLKVLARVDLVVVNDGEARQLTSELNLVKAAYKIREMGPDIVIIKKGEHGVLLLYKHEFLALPAYPLETVMDPTGAGDSFAGALMGFLASQPEINSKTIHAAIAHGTIVASFTVEGFGPEVLAKLTPASVKERLELFKKISSFC